MKKKFIILFLMLTIAGMMFGAPLNETFDSATIPTDWVNDTGDGGGDWNFVTSNSHCASGDNTTGTGYYAHLNDYSIYTSQNPVNLITPRLDLTSGSTDFVYYYWIGSNSATNPIIIDVSSDGGSNWTEGVYTHDHTTTGAWTQNTISLAAYTASNNVLVRFRGISNYGWNFCNSGIDDVSGPNLYVPANPAPTDITTTNITSTSADLDWTNGGSESAWEVEWGPSGFTQGSGTTISPISTHPYNLNPPLSALTTYDWYVRADYGSGTYSDWSGPATFSTGLSSLPYSQNFDGVTPPDLPAGWTYIDDTGNTYSYIETYAGYANSSPNAVEMYNASASTGNFILISPSTTEAISGLRVSFWVCSESTYDTAELIVGTMTDPADPTTFSSLQTVTPTLTYTQHTINLSSTRTTTYVAFKHDLSDTYSEIHIDDVTIEEIPTTPVFSINPESKDFGTILLGSISDPQTFTITNSGVGTLTINSGAITLTGTDADQFNLTDNNTYPINLVEGESATVDVDFEPTTEGVKTATLQIIDNTDATQTVDLTGTGLDPEIYTFPYLQNFDGVTAPDLPADWTYLNDTGNTYSYIETYAGYANSSPNAVEMYNSGATTGNFILISPPTNVAISGLRVSFWVCSESTADTAELIVGTMTDPTDPATFSSLQTVTPSTTYTQYTVDLISTRTTTYVAFKHDLSDTYSEIHIDDVTIEEIPIVPVFSINPEDKNFGLLIAGNTSDPQTFNITNSGQGMLTLNDGDISITGSDPDQFTLTDNNAYPIELGMGESADIDVTFAPTTAGDKTANLHIEDNISDATHDIPLSGTAYPADYVFEGFDDTTFPPVGWTNDGWSRSTTNYEGGGSAYRYGSTTTQYLLNTPKLNVTSDDVISFWARNTSTSGSLEIVYSGDGVTWSLLETISYSASYTWEFNEVDLTTIADTDLYIGFRTGSYSSSNYIDNVIHPPAAILPAEVPTNPYPADLAVDVLENIDLTWTNGFGTDNVDVYFDTVNPPVIKVLDDVSAVEIYDPGTMAYSQTYYWQVVCKNSYTEDEAAGPIWSFATRDDPTVTTYPYTEDFETFVSGTNATGYANNWITSPENTTSEFRWNVDAGGTPSGSTGPSADHTSGLSTGIYLFTEATSGSEDDIAYIYTPPFDLTGLSTPAVSFWYHMYGSSMGELHVDLWNGTSWINDITTALVGQQQTSSTADWLEKNVELFDYSGQTISLRFRAIRGDNYYSDMAIDDFSLENVPVGILNGTVSEFSTDGPIENATISFGDWSTTTGVDGSYSIANVYAGTYDITCEADGYFSETVNDYEIIADQTNTLNFDLTWAECALTPTSINETLDSGAMQTVPVTITNNGTGDLDYSASLEFLTDEAEVEDFEADDGGYSSGTWSGTLDSWEWGTPSYASGPATAYSGTNCWATNLSGDFNDSESSYMESIEFDLAGAEDPELVYYHWYDMGSASWDGVNVKVSNDGGTTWNLLIPDVGYHATTCSNLNNEQVFSGTLTTWTEVRFDLSAYVNDMVSFRWYLGTSSVVPNPGYYIDDVSIEGLVYETWLQITSNAAGTIPSGGNTVMDVLLDAAGLSDITRTGNINITHNGQNITETLATIPVTMHVNEVTTAPNPATNPSPATNAEDVDLLPLLSWTNNGVVNGSKIEMKSSIWQPTWTEIDSIAGTANSYQIVNHLAYDKHYQWRVTNYNLIGSSSPSIWFFDTITAAAANPTPADDSTNVFIDAILDWDDVAYADSFLVYLWYDDGLADNPVMILDGETAMTSDFDPVDDFLFNTEYFWYVETYRDLRLQGTSDTWSFTTITAEPVAPYNPTPADDALDVTPVGLTLEWECLNGDTYDVYLDPVGTDVPTTLVADDITTTYFELTTSLEWNTEYEWQVVATNAADRAVTNGPIWSFTTIGAVSAPFVEDFENDGDIPLYWENVPSTDGDDWDFVTYMGYGADTDHTSGSGYFAAIDDSEAPIADPATLLSPKIDLTTLTVPYLQFWYWIGDDVNSSTLYLDIYDGSVWTNDVAILTANGEWEEVGINIVNYLSSETQLRFRGEEYYTAYSYYSDICLDDVSITEAPACIPPSALVVTNLTATSADIGWTENNIPPATSWNIEWGPTGFTQGTGTMITGTSDNPYSISGLTAETSYDWYVQADNGSDELSDWAGPNTFSTLFDGIQIGNGTSTAQHLPIEPYYGYSYTQTIYQSGDFGTVGANPQIETIWYNYSFTGGDDDSDDWTIYMGTTTNSTLADWIPIGDLTQVFDGDVNLELVSGDGWLEITLDTPFSYEPATDGNLVIAVDENTPSYCSSSDEFYCDQDTRANVSVYFYNDSTNPDPASPPAVGTTFSSLSSYYPNTRFNFGTAAPPAAPTNVAISVDTSGNTVITWDAVTGANSYHIYGCDTPDGTFVDVTADGSFTGESWTSTAPMGDMKFFYVTSDTAGGGDIIFTGSNHNDKKPFEPSNRDGGK
ncbi:MAG: choice-of-anchor J domain-containing protein [Candidatus Cloacimonetes bacterium]|nr:choice-of-anchor J domain-containing protein [Candidatus Cloacimonadota bacterium]MCF7882830.1 choice-of-anchor J domain-containing protein [Candidatus Cloacimonadota bacterium]